MRLKHSRPLSPRLPESTASIAVSVALVLALLLSGIFAFLTIAGFAFAQTTPLMFVSCGIASGFTGIVIPLVAIIAWFLRSRTVEPPRPMPPYGPLLTAIACLLLGVLVTIGTIVTIVTMGGSL